MRAVGIIIIILGIVASYYSVMMDTTIETNIKSNILDNYGMTSRVNNIGLMNDKQNYVVLSGILTLCGVIVFCFGVQGAQAEELQEKQSNIDHKLGMLIFEYKKNHETAEPEMEKTFGGKSLSEFYNETMKKSEAEEKIKPDSGLK
jgi:hypothetical protein